MFLVTTLSKPAHPAFQQSFVKTGGNQIEQIQAIHGWKHPCSWVNRPRSQAALTVRSVIQSHSSLKVHLSICMYHLNVRFMMGPGLLEGWNMQMGGETQAAFPSFEYADGRRDSGGIMSGHLRIRTSWITFSCPLSCQSWMELHCYNALLLLVTLALRACRQP